MTTKQKIILDFILQKENKTSTIREVIDFCKTDKNFSGYIPESAKGVYCSLIKNGILIRESDVLKVASPQSFSLSLFQNSFL